MLNRYPLLLVLTFLAISVLIILRFNKDVFHRIIKHIFNWKFLYCSSFVIILFAADWLFLNGNGHEISETFYNHAWIEIASGFIIYMLLEFKIKEYGEVPTEDGERDYRWILEGIAKSKRTVRIIDNDFTSFFEGKDKQKEPILKLQLKKRLISCLQSFERTQVLEILLLHPNTSAARQRHDDLLNINDDKGNFQREFDLYERINAGLQFLFEFIEEDLQNLTDPSGTLLKEKIQVKLFNTSYSLVFVAWDQFINFSLLHPEKFTDKETFKTLRHTPLAGYFIKNFKEIWKDERTVDLMDYKRVIIQDQQGNNLFDNIPWGPDSHQHDLPIFISIPPDRSTQLLVQQTRSESHRVRIIHNGKTLWAKLIELDENELEDDVAEGHKASIKVMKNITEYAKGQIIKKNKAVLENCTFYKIKYSNQQRIMLQDDNYVKRHLETRGYCFTPHTKYVVFLGLHLKKMLNALYFFFTVLYRKIENDDTVKRPYKRLLVSYVCTISNENEVIVTNAHSQKASSFQQFDFTSMAGLTDEEASLMDEMNNLLKRTIEADILRVHGLQYGELKKNITNRKHSYNVTVHLIQAKVNNINYVPHRHDDSYKENEGLYTVLHFVGKKNITGGMPSIYIGDSKTPEKDYNFNSTLDSIYVKTTGSSRGRIIVDSSSTRYNKHEARQRINDAIIKHTQSGTLTKDIQRQIENDNEYGYRNVIAIEFNAPHSL